MPRRKRGGVSMPAEHDIVGQVLHKPGALKGLSRWQLLALAEECLVELLGRVVEDAGDAVHEDPEERRALLGADAAREAIAAAMERYD